jgi:shikimate kinase
MNALIDAPPSTTADSAIGSIESLTMPLAPMNAAPTRSHIAAPAVPGGVNRIVLTGFMGAGKTTVGRRLAAQLGWEFLDLDALIEHRTGMTVPQIFAEQGEPAFRRLESLALAVALGRKKIVLALGGGTPEMLTNRLLLEQTPGTLTVYLHAPLDVLTARCLAQEGATKRPVLSNTAELASRFAARLPHYQRLAGIIVDTVSTNTDETVVHLCEQLKSHK